MVFTAAQTTAFFKAATQMTIPHNTVFQLVTKGINTVDDLADFDKENLQQVATNFRRPPGGAVAFTFGAKSEKRLLAASILVKFYQAIGRDLTTACVGILSCAIFRNSGKLSRRRRKKMIRTPL